MAVQRQINLLRGWPNPSLLPTASILRASEAALSDPSISIPGLQYGPDPGYQPLREEIADWTSRFFGGEKENLVADPEKICITGGASQNLACVLQVFTDPLKTRVWMVAPCYFLACRIFEDSGLRCRGVGEGEAGVDLRALEEELEKVEKEEGDVEPLKRTTPWSKIYRHIIYCVPTFSNPSGKTMTLSVREGLVKLARKYDALIITDDVYDFLQWSTDSNSTSSFKPKALLPRLVDIDQTLDPVPPADSFGNAMSNGSFSKIAGPGVRTGWAEAAPKFVYGLSQCGSSRSGGAPSQLTATIITELLKSGDLMQHIENVLCPAYQKRHKIIQEAIEKHLFPLGVKLGEVNFEGKAVFGGYFIWIDLPEDISAKAVAQRAREEENLIIAPGYLFEVSNDPSIKFAHSIRLCFSYEEEADLKEGVKRLGKAIMDARDGTGARISEEAGQREVMSDLGEFR